MTTTDYRADQSIIAEAEICVIRERQAGRRAVFTQELVGIYASFRQRRLFELAMLREEMRLDGVIEHELYRELYRQVSTRMQDFLAPSEEH
jgi:hypothetical protein